MILISFWLVLVLYLLVDKYQRRNYEYIGSNLILISIDTLRADHMGIYGYQRNLTPNMDEFGKDTIFFKNAYAPWPKTTPSFTSFFTGMHPFTTGIERIAPFQKIRDDLIFLTELLRQHGYFTQGKSANPHFSKENNFAQGFDEFETLSQLEAQQLTQLAIQDLRCIVNKDRKFFYWVHYIDPHWQYKPHKEYASQFINDALYDSEKMIPVCPKYIEYIPDMHQGESYEKTRRLRINRGDFGCCWFEKGLISESIARYDGEIKHTDTNIGLLLSEIKRLGLFENSVIVLTADHGESLGDHDFYFDHGRFPYNACLKIPLMIHHPRLKPKEVESVVSLIDMFPTLLGILGVHSPCDGEDISDILLGRERKRIIFSSAGYAINYQKIITDGRWKLIYVPDELDQTFMKNATYQLYDLMKDPGETENLFGSSVKGMYLKDKLDDFLKNKYKKFTQEREALDYNEDNLRQLKTLGYIN